MSESDITHRAQEASRLSNEPLLIKALDGMMDRANRDLITLPSTAHEERWLICCEMKIIRGFRAELASMIQNGKQADRVRPAVA